MEKNASETHAEKMQFAATFLVDLNVLASLVVREILSEAASVKELLSTCVKTFIVVTLLSAVSKITWSQNVSVHLATLSEILMLNVSDNFLKNNFKILKYNSHYIRYKLSLLH